MDSLILQYLQRNSNKIYVNIDGIAMLWFEVLLNGFYYRILLAGEGQPSTVLS